MISVDTIDRGATTRATYKVPFPLLADPDATAHAAFRVVNTLDAEGKEKLAGYGIDVPRWSGEDHGKIAIPALFLIDRGKTIRWAHADRNHRVRPDVDALLPALKAALAR